MSEPSSNPFPPELWQLLHDINNKIGFVSLVLDLIEEEPTLGEEGRGHVSAARTAVQDLRTLLGSLSSALKTQTQDPRNRTKPA